MKVDTLTKKPTAALKKLLWEWFSRYIRLRDQGLCFTCSTIKDYKEMDAGHFFDASLCPPELYFHEKNCNCQCDSCNRYKSGNKVIYAIRLESKYGLGVIQELEQIKIKRKHWTRIDYAEKIVYYREKAKELGYIC